jgi:hypothetical protein
MGVSNNGTNAFTIFDVNDNPLWIFKDNGNTVSENGKLAIGTSSNLYSSDFSVQGKTIFQAKNAGSAVLGGWAQSNGASITTMFENGKMIFGGFQLIGSEKISIQGETFIQGTGTTTGTTLALYDADSPSPNKTWEWLDNGNVITGQDNFIYFDDEITFLTQSDINTKFRVSNGSDKGSRIFVGGSSGGFEGLQLMYFGNNAAVDPLKRNKQGLVGEYNHGELIICNNAGGDNAEIWFNISDGQTDDLLINKRRAKITKNDFKIHNVTGLIYHPTDDEPTKIGTENVSLQGSTAIKGLGTTTGTTLALYDADSPSPNKTWEWLDNGNVNLSIDSVITLNNTLKIESGQTYLDNGSFNPLVLNVKSSGVDGIGLDFNAYNSSNVETNFARIVQAATDVTAGSENGGLLLRTMISGTLRTGVTLDNREFLIDAANFTDNGFRVKDGIIDCLKVTTNKQTYIESGSFNPLVLLFKSSGVDGIGLDFNAYNSSNAEHNFARIIQAATDVTAGSENGGLLLRVSDNGTITTKIEINSNKVLLYDNLDMNNNRILNSVVNPSVQEAANSATFTINADEQSDGVLTAMSASTTIAAPTGTPVQSQDLVFRFKDDGTARSLTWNAVFRAIGVTLPTTTVANKLTYVGCKYNSTDSKWDVIAVQQEA